MGRQVSGQGEERKQTPTCRTFHQSDHSPDAFDDPVMFAISLMDHPVRLVDFETREGRVSKVVEERDSGGCNDSESFGLEALRCL